MTEPIFVKIRNDQGEIYPSYDIYWQLIELSGFQTCELDEVEPMSSNVYIFSPDNGNVLAACMRDHTAKYILWQLEIPGPVNAAIPAHFDEMWVSCRFWQSLVPEAKFVPMGGHPSLYRENESVKQWDFCHLAYIYGKRGIQVGQLEAQGYTMAPVGFGEVRDKAIAASRWGLIMHQNPVPALSPQRMTLFACRKLPMIVEECDPYPYDVIVTHIWPPVVPDEKEYTEMVEHNFTYFTETMTFRMAVEGALA